MWGKIKKYWHENPLGVFFFIAGVLIVLVLGNYLVEFSFERSNSQEVWGQFGDYFGGVLNPILSFFALGGLLVTLRAQQREAAKANERHIQQTFDARLFQLLSLSHDAVAAVKYVHYSARLERTEYDGHRGVAYALNRLQEDFLYKAARGGEGFYERLREKFEGWRKIYWSGVASYTESMLFILRYVFSERPSGKDNEFALRAVFAQMSSDEKLLLLYVMLFNHDVGLIVSGQTRQEFMSGVSVDDLLHFRSDLLREAAVHRCAQNANW